MTYVTLINDRYLYVMRLFFMLKRRGTLQNPYPIWIYTLYPNTIFSHFFSTIYSNYIVIESSDCPFHLFDGLMYQGNLRLREGQIHFLVSLPVGQQYFGFVNVWWIRWYGKNFHSEVYCSRNITFFINSINLCDITPRYFLFDFGITPK